MPMWRDIAGIVRVSPTRRSRNSVANGLVQMHTRTDCGKRKELIMILLRLLAAFILFAASVGTTSDAGGGIDPNGAAVSAQCGGDYTACVDPNGRPGQ